MTKLPSEMSDLKKILFHIVSFLKGEAKVRTISHFFARVAQEMWNSCKSVVHITWVWEQQEWDKTEKQSKKASKAEWTCIKTSRDALYPCHIITNKNKNIKYIAQGLPLYHGCDFLYTMGVALNDRLLHQFITCKISRFRATWTETTL